MRIKLLFISGLALGLIATSSVRGDQLEMQNGDRYFGKVLSVSADNVVLESEILGKVNVPRKKVLSLTFGATALAPAASSIAAPPMLPTNIPTAMSTSSLLRTNADLSGTARNLSGKTEFVRQVRDQLLAGSPEAAAKFDELATGLMTGKLSLNDLRNQAKSSADQLRALKHDLGPDVGDSLDAYLSVLDAFLQETPIVSTTPPSTPAR